MLKLNDAYLGSKKFESCSKYKYFVQFLKRTSFWGETCVIEIDKLEKFGLYTQPQTYIEFNIGLCIQQVKHYYELFTLSIIFMDYCCRVFAKLAYFNQTVLFAKLASLTWNKTANVWSGNFVTYYVSGIYLSSKKVDSFRT